MSELEEKGIINNIIESELQMFEKKSKLCFNLIFALDMKEIQMSIVVNTALD
jgi:hypothetical protein